MKRNFAEFSLIIRIRHFGNIRYCYYKYSDHDREDIQVEGYTVEKHIIQHYNNDHIFKRKFMDENYEQIT